jgi:hypothetical protein
LRLLLRLDVDGDDRAAALRNAAAWHVHLDNPATSPILPFGNNLNANLDREPKVQGADFQDYEFRVRYRPPLRVQGLFQTLLRGKLRNNFIDRVPIAIGDVVGNGT